MFSHNGLRHTAVPSMDAAMGAPGDNFYQSNGVFPITNA